MIHTQLWIQCPEHLLTFTARSESVNVSNTLYSHMQQTHINTGCFVHLSLTDWWWNLHGSGASVQIFWIRDSSRSFSRSSLNSPRSVTAHMDILRNSCISYLMLISLSTTFFYHSWSNCVYCIRAYNIFQSFKLIFYISRFHYICALLANTF